MFRAWPEGYYVGMPFATVPQLSRRSFSLALAGSIAARAAGEQARWALLSDTHIPADASNEYRGFRPVDNLKKVAPQVEQWKPEGVMICGDLARLEGLPGDYAALKQLLTPILNQAPVAMALGNHDHRENFLAGFGVQKGAQTLKARHVVSVDAGPVRMVVLDSLVAPNSTPGLLGKAQRQWLADHLDASDGKPVIICVHHTLDDSDGALLDAPRLFDVIRTRRKVKAVLYGHSHEHKYETLDGIHLVNLPAIGYNFRDSEPVGWVEGVFRGDGAALTLRAFAGNQAASGKTVELKWR
jgi:3',5'-cyclic AMP phosphodiesterase CpdA